MGISGHLFYHIYCPFPQWVISTLEDFHNQKSAVLVIFKVKLAGHKKEAMKLYCSWLHQKLSPCTMEKGTVQNFLGCLAVVKWHEIKVSLLLGNTNSKLCIGVSIMRWHFPFVLLTFITGTRSLYHLEVRRLELKIKSRLPPSTQINVACLYLVVVMGTRVYW